MIFRTLFPNIFLTFLAINTVASKIKTLRMIILFTMSASFHRSIV
jgi:hypothetical protein